MHAIRALLFLCFSAAVSAAEIKVASLDDLQKAIDANASKDELKAKLAKFREARKQKEAKLQQAQEELRKVLSIKQEAAAVLNGLLQ